MKRMGVNYLPISIIVILIQLTACGLNEPPTPTPTPSPSTPPGTIVPVLEGFAALNSGTTGGAGGDIVYVGTGTDLQNAINVWKSSNPTGRATRTSPRIIYVNGTITPANSTLDSKINIKGSDDANPFENISIIGIGTSGELNGIGIKVWKAKNIIIQNLKIHHVNIGDKDAIGIEGPASYIWVDHCELHSTDPAVQLDGDYYDGLLDAKSTSEYITVSWNYFHDHWKTSLVGSSDGDVYDRKISYHHNYFYNLNSRLPSYRTGQGHVYNNYYEKVATGAVNSRREATLRVEGNYFKNVNDPICSKDSPQPFGKWDLGPGTNVDSNIYENCTWGATPATEYTNASILGFVDTCTYTPPYTYTLETPAQAKTRILAEAGVGKIAGP